MQAGGLSSTIRRWEQAHQRKEEYFVNLEKHRKDFFWEDEQDGEAIELAFSKKKKEERKSWLMQFEELEKSDARSEELRKKMRGKARGEAAMKSTRQAPKNPRKNNNKKANNAESVAEAVSSSMAAMEIERAPEAAKPKGGAGSRNAPAKPKKQTLVLNDDDDDDVHDDDVLEFKERLAAYNLDSPADQSAGRCYIIIFHSTIYYDLDTTQLKCRKHYCG